MVRQRQPSSYNRQRRCDNLHATVTNLQDASMCLAGCTVLGTVMNVLLQPSSWPSTAETKSHSHRWILNRLLGDREASRTTARLCTRLEHFACGSCYGSRGASDQAPLHDQVPGTLCRSMMGHMRLQILMYQYSVT